MYAVFVEILNGHQSDVISVCVHVCEQAQVLDFCRICFLALLCTNVDGVAPAIRGPVASVAALPAGSFGAPPNFSSSLGQVSFTELRPARPDRGPPCVGCNQIISILVEPRLPYYFVRADNVISLFVAPATPLLLDGVPDASWTPRVDTSVCVLKQIVFYLTSVVRC